MQIGDFTQTEADYLEAVCNFSPDELQLFLLRCNHKTIGECAILMNRSEDSTKKISRKVAKKIKREL